VQDEQAGRVSHQPVSGGRERLLREIRFLDRPEINRMWHDDPRMESKSVAVKAKQAIWDDLPDF